MHSQAPDVTLSGALTNDVDKNINTKDYGFLPIPKRLRHDPSRPFKFSITMNVTFGIAGMFTGANLYYCQPLLIQFSESFGVSYREVSKDDLKQHSYKVTVGWQQVTEIAQCVDSQWTFCELQYIPTLVQAGYATGLLLIAPLGDLVHRRSLILLLILTSGSLTIGLAVTKSLATFEALYYLVGVSSVVPQIMMPLAADLAPPDRKASAISIVLSGILFGVLLARVLAGVIAQFTTWRVVYYVAIGAQFTVLAAMYLVLPDYPAKNRGMTYFGILYTMAKFAVTEPLLIQSALIIMFSNACFSNFWVTLTFLLGGAPYHYSTLVIGLFGLVGMFGVAMGPLVGRFVDRLVPWYATLVATLGLLAFQAIQTGAEGISVVAVIIGCFGLDVFDQMQQVSLTTAVWTIDESARARLNAIMILSIFVGQVMGTSIGTKLFVDHGWRASMGLSMGFYGLQLLLLLLRGPHCERRTWFGYQGGTKARKEIVTERQQAESDIEGLIIAPERIDRTDTGDTKKLTSVA